MRLCPSPSDRRARTARLVSLALIAALACAPRASALDAGPVSRAPAIVPVLVDNAKLIRLPQETQTVVVGNPMIADVSLQKNGVLILTGKAFGTTNLIALDANGVLIAESTIRVEALTASTITVQRGLERESYSCTPECQPSAQLGDSTRWYTDVSSQADRRRSLAAGAGGAPSGPK